jgi:hypothetical protein
MSPDEGIEGIACLADIHLAHAHDLLPTWIQPIPTS